METIIRIRTENEEYAIRDVLSDTMSVGDLIDVLKNMPSEAKIVFTNDNGFTFGGLRYDSFREIEIETKEEEQEREEREAKVEEQEEMDNLIQYIKNRIDEMNGEIILAMDGFEMNFITPSQEENLIITELTTKINGSLYGNTNWGLINLEETITELEEWDYLFSKVMDVYAES